MTLVAYYRQKDRVASWMYYFKPASLLLSALLYTISHILLVSASEPTHRVMVTQYTLWAFAFVIELVGHALTPDDSREVLRGSGSLTARLATLTVIVVGEGMWLEEHSLFLH
jgi:hypothetical protein